MSGERPLWPEGLRNKLKLPPIEYQRTEALIEGVFTQVAKQPNPAERPVQEQAEPQAGKNKLSEEADEVDIPYGMGMVWPQPPFPPPRPDAGSVGAIKHMLISANDL